MYIFTLISLLLKLGLKKFSSATVIVSSGFSEFESGVWDGWPKKNPTNHSNEEIGFLFSSVPCEARPRISSILSTNSWFCKTPGIRPERSPHNSPPWTKFTHPFFFEWLLFCIAGVN